jgi:two-component system sensor histidine kinase LytS
MSKLDTWIDNKIVQNIIIWVFVLLIFAMMIQAENKLQVSLLIILFIIPPIYISNLKILPFFFKGKVKLGLLLFFINLSFFTFLGVLFLSEAFQEFRIEMILNVFGAVLLIILFGTALKLTRDSFVRRQQEKEAELKLLKAQLNPHFLFNTLNNLYGLSVVKSDKLPNLMLKLSDLLRYSLYETKETFVPLEKEIQYLENYIALEKIRLEEKTTIQFTKTGNVSSQKIAPMLLIVFVENAFKHLGEVSNTKSSVAVSIDMKEDRLEFSCVNTTHNTQGIEPNLEKGKSGIGLQNAKKRLALIYQEKHALRITNTENAYSVALTLYL